MAITLYLAMTATEFAESEALPPKVGGMVCQDLTEISRLPEGSLLILSDQAPICGQEIVTKLRQAVEAWDCSSILLDFQKPDIPEQAALAAQLVRDLSCPVAVSDLYAGGLDCPVFLSPCPHHVHLREHIQPWEGRELWLDLAADAETILLTPQGVSISPLSLPDFPEECHQDEKLHCHYRIETGKDSARFLLWRTREDLASLAQEGEALGIQTLVGLFQELGTR